MPTANSTPKPPTPRKKKDEAPARPILFPVPKPFIAAGPNALNEEKAKEMLGWTVLGDDDKRKPLLIDEEGNKVVCTFNWGNRPFRLARSKSYKTRFLKRRWYLNGEALVIGKTGRIMSGQHRLIGYVLACQAYRGKDAAHWKTFGTTPPVYETFINYGIDESKEVVRSIDQVMTRTTSDTLFTDESFLPKVTDPADRFSMCRMAERSVKFIWKRTAVSADPFAPSKDSGEIAEWVGKHPRLGQCVQHIWEENQAQYTEDADGKKMRLPDPVGFFLPPGDAAGLMYLMATGDSDFDAYRDKGRVEKALSFSRWEKASEFWVLLASRSPDFTEVRSARRPDSAETDEAAYYFSTGEGSGSLDEKLAVLVKAWQCFYEGEPIQSVTQIQPRYVVDEYGTHLDECPAVGGIDLGDPKPEPKPVEKPEQEAIDDEDEDDPAGAEDEPTEEEIARQAEIERLRRQEEANEEEERRKLAGKERRKNLIKERHAKLQEGGAGVDVAPSPAPESEAEETPKAPPKPKRKTRKDVEAEQTEAARRADAELAAANGAAPE